MMSVHHERLVKFIGAGEVINEQSHGTLTFTLILTLALMVRSRTSDLMGYPPYFWFKSS